MAKYASAKASQANKVFAFGGARNVADLLNQANELTQPRNKLICKGLILRGLANTDQKRWRVLLSELLEGDRVVETRNDVQMQSLLLRCCRKSGSLAKLAGRIDVFEKVCELIRTIRTP